MTKLAWRWIGCGAVCLVALGGVPAAAQETEMTAEQKAAMAAWTRAMTPGPEHRELAARAGKWSASVSMWEAPGTPPQISQGSCKRRMILGGRVMAEEWTGSMMGMPFEGFGTTGFDNASGSWWSTWSDNFGTGVMNAVGECDPDPKKGCTFTASFVDPISGKAKKSRSTVSWSSPDDELTRMYDVDAAGKEWQAMEIKLHRLRE
ncbi:MAG: DUF1579 family protein [Thermoanaerobaculia bacterium]